MEPEKLLVVLSVAASRGKGRQTYRDDLRTRVACTTACFLVSARSRRVVGIPEVLVGIPCPLHPPVRLEAMVGSKEQRVQVLRRLPAMPTAFVCAA